MKKCRKKLCIAGGDIRMRYASERLADVFDIVEYDAEKKEYTDILLFPPVTSDSSGRIFSPLTKEPPDVEKMLDMLKAEGLVLVGMKGETVEKAAEEKGNTIINYMHDEMLALGNAVPTAEGAIVRAIEKTGRTINGSRILVAGCGKTGTALSERLVKLGAEVTAAARKEKDRKRITGLGAEAISFGEIKNAVKNADIIFNTVPSRVFTEENMENINRGCVYIEIASEPYGADPELFRRKDIGYMCASGLPPNGM